MRAALLPTPGDPASLAYWLANFATWRGEVDELVVYVNGPVDPALIQPMIEAAGGRMLYHPESIGHDGALLRLLNETKAEYVVLCEDDAYVRHPGAVTSAFGRIEAGHTDIVGSPRGEDYFGQFVEWGPYRPGDVAELKHGLWPAFLFARRADILATDRWLADHVWYLGETIPGWGVVTREACAAIGLGSDWLHLDTLFGTTFQLRAAGLRTELVHHVRLYDPPAVEAWLAEDPPWCHVTNLSTLHYVTAGLPVGTIPDFGPQWTRRLAWWRRMGIDVAGFVRRAGVDEADLAAWDRRFDGWVAA